MRFFKVMECVRFFFNFKENPRHDIQFVLFKLDRRSTGFKLKTLKIMLNHIPNDGCMIFEKTFKKNLEKR